MIFDKLPELAREMAAPISKVDKIVMVSNDGKMGTSKITSELATMLSQLPTVVKEMSGFDLETWLKNYAQSRTDSGTGTSEKE